MDLFFDSYEPLQKADTGNIPMTRIHVTTPNPDPDQQGRTDAYVDLTDAQINGAASQAAFWTLVTTELGRVYRKNAVKVKLTPFIGSSTTV